MSCTDCFNGCGTPMPDTCVKYTGPDISALGITSGDPLSKVEEILLNMVQDFSEGDGITLSSINMTCTYLTSLLSTSPKTLKNIIQVLVTAICSLKTSVTALESVNTGVSFDTSCLTGLPTNPTLADIVEAMLTNLCALNTTVNTIFSDYVKASQLNSLIASYLSSTSGSTQQYTKMVPYVAYEYFGPLSNFDSNGKGISAAGFDKVYVCNGSYGTPDHRGRTPIGAVQGVPGALALDSAVDPSIPANAGTNYVLGQKVGMSYVTLISSQMPVHSHTINDPGHAHTFEGAKPSGGGGDSSRDGVQITLNTNSSTTGITINSTGGGQPHDNRQPSIAAYFIMYIP